VQRKDSLINLKLYDGLIRKLNTRSSGYFATIRFPFIVKSFAEGSNSEKAGLLANDRVIGINNIETFFYHEIQKAIKGKKNETIQVKLIRGKDTLVKPVQLDNKGMFGVGIRNLEDLGIETKYEKFTFLEAIPAGFRECWITLGRYMTGLRQLFTGKANPNESVGSVFSIGSIYPKEWDWRIFWTLTAVFSIILAFMNILPIPGLDGGHALFTLAEIITGRKPSDKFLEYAQMVGMVLLMALMAYALGLDVLRWFK
jgi:regulator of sigma E protease